MVVSGAGAQSACKRIHRRRARGGNMLQCGPWNSGAPASRAQWPAALSSRHVVGTRMATAPWWRGAVIYQIYPRSFLDTNGDGVGDLPGIIARLDHVASLGVDAIWVSPFFTSPMADYGYDIADFRGVDPMFGTLGDYDRFLENAHGLVIKVMIDQGLRPSPYRHPSLPDRRSTLDDPRSDCAVPAGPNPDGTPPNNWMSLFGGVAWTWEPRREQYYLHNFLSAQPQLNFHNPDVRAAMLDNLRFWLDRGVDGMRLDSI